MARKQPEFFATEQAAFEGASEVTLNRSRPVMAQDTESQQFIVCCATTARKYGWNILGKLYARNLNRAGRTATAETKADTAPAPTGAKLAPWDQEPKLSKKAKQRKLNLDEILGTDKK